MKELKQQVIIEEHPDIEINYVELKMSLKMSLKTKI